MKKTLIPILLLLSSLLSAQETTTKNVIDFNTIEKNKKTILLYKQTTGNNVNYILSAKNKTSRDFSKCEWVSLLTKKELKHFTEMLEEIKQGETIETKLVTLKSKKNKVHIYFNNTTCTSEHKTHYFQKSCKRGLSFLVLQKQIKELAKTLTKEVEQSVLANN